MDQQVTVPCKLKALWAVGVAKASLNRADQYGIVDAKPGDLTMARLKRSENCVEDRTHKR
ncbi:MAG: hypothetical protein COW13_03195 [Candidatus Omnitrophica bacterium CG12_big_fil_rev_8_21_14_0_65_50_5]|nr:MAG: hypothetical protein COW13_03195 [Candidatus Omnitrophica bacterium CG12_big_fil_rev_8_21_14_0_65_50_5]